MTLTAGARLGPYEVIALIGAGGMGEVYRARDTRLQRDVALKILPELFADDAERLARFHREAQLVASLNHPQIAVVHGLEESAGYRVSACSSADACRRTPAIASTTSAICVSRSMARSTCRPSKSQLARCRGHALAHGLRLPRWVVCFWAASAHGC